MLRDMYVTWEICMWPARYVCDPWPDLRTGSNQQLLAQGVVAGGRSRLAISQIHAHQPEVRPSEVHAEVCSILYTNTRGY